VLVLLGTGWWLLLGQEGNPSPLSRLTGRPDTQLHTWVGWVMTAIVVAGLVVGTRAAATFAVESMRFRRSDLGWFLSWPKALLTGRFARHEGHFDPGQRIANIVLVGILVTLVVSGVGWALLHGGPAFAVLVHVHRWSTYAVTPVLLGHILIAAGVLPATAVCGAPMHLGGHLDVEVARRGLAGLARAQRIRFAEHTRQNRPDRLSRRPLVGGAPVEPADRPHPL
jgi:formate dehydrogenase subunit gamma